LSAGINEFGKPEVFVNLTLNDNDPDLKAFLKHINGGVDKRP
jgi:hypothetical protein